MNKNEEWTTGEELHLRLMMLAGLVVAVAGLVSPRSSIATFMVYFGFAMLCVLFLCKAALVWDKRKRDEQ